MRRRWGRILLGDNTVSGTVVLRLIILQYAGVWISAGHPFMYLHVYLAICMLNFNMCLGFQKVTVKWVGVCSQLTKLKIDVSL